MSEVEATTEVLTPGAPSELDAATEAFIKTTEAEYAAESALPEPITTPTEAGGTSEAKEGQDTVTPAAAKPDEQVDTATAIVKALEESRAKARTEKAARKAAKAAKAAEPLPPQDEIEALRRLGYDPDLIVRKVIAQRLGDKAPKELRDTLVMTDMQRQMAALENKVITQQRELAARQYFDTVAAGAKTYIGTGEFSKDAPTVAEIAKRDPNRVHAEVMQEIVSDARERSQRDPNGDVMSYSAAVAKVEARWADMRKMFMPPPSDGTSDASTTVTTPTQVQEKKTAAKAVKPPDRPLAPWLQRVQVEEDGIKVAMDEFRRAETARKPQ